ncbi:hypothetical protein [Algicella marina]|uniref:Uncharacterized protein n=1 Tax=Algicella marina TaxID=2683284 RepID=A0A6P1SWG3_9RHOB|nr:hypothetical protein [Algicella marina]QHQ33865.1 hypothetical protein GO499_01050 [Algicella marina]
MLRYLVILSCLAFPALAQVSLDDLNAEVDARAKELTTFEDALADTDEKKALAAMQILIERGDADQKRMAIRSGLYSTKLAMRSEVLRAIFNSAPSINVYMKPLTEKPTSQYIGFVKRNSGALQTDGRGSIVIKVGPWKPEEQCWLYQKNTNYCLATLNADVVSMSLATWVQLTLDESGTLRGTSELEGTPVEVSIPLAQ